MPIAGSQRPRWRACTVQRWTVQPQRHSVENEIKLREPANFHIWEVGTREYLIFFTVCCQSIVKLVADYFSVHPLIGQSTKCFSPRRDTIQEVQLQWLVNAFEAKAQRSVNTQRHYFSYFTIYYYTISALIATLLRQLNCSTKMNERAVFCCCCFLFCFLSTVLLSVWTLPYIFQHKEASADMLSLLLKSGWKSIWDKRNQTFQRLNVIKQQ